MQFFTGLCTWYHWNFWREQYLTHLVTQLLPSILHLFILLRWALSCTRPLVMKYSFWNISLHCIQVKIHFSNRKGKKAILLMLLTSKIMHGHGGFHISFFSWTSWRIWLLPQLNLKILILPQKMTMENPYLVLRPTVNIAECAVSCQG